MISSPECQYLKFKRIQNGKYSFTSRNSGQQSVSNNINQNRLIGIRPTGWRCRKVHGQLWEIEMRPTALDNVT